ncbi:hypothetical protein HIM_09730 [Hirsutella minnesotensis 3608]|uniref:FAD-binding PCMH-type domain-containing protein n=1 Tax=Hirsutella minnesotensis 3608 TaxID=1043627 RepID=A0A0F7ZL05_9HYPO|nr:hypothetical protein HIM_09730 [Hirsutella minnesotensis 3608]
MTAIDQLKTALTGEVITPVDGSKYEAALARPWSQLCWTPAAGYVSIKNVQELADALAIINSADKAGIVLDIGQLHSKELRPDGTARVGSGNTWGEVYAWLEEQNRSAIGGRDPQVGLGGFLLGGGMGALPNLHGLGADGVKNFEVLLADGPLVNANGAENTDLYRALKGGGSNFGIVTRFDLETHPLIKVQYTINLYKPDDYIRIIEATIKVQEAMEQDAKIGLFTHFNQGFVAVGMIYADTPVDRPPAFESFDKLDSFMMAVAPTTNGTLLSLAQAMSHEQAPMKRTIRTMTTKVSQELYVGVYKAWMDICKWLPAGCVLHFTIQPMGHAGVRAGKVLGENIMGLESTPQCLFTCEWPGEGGDDESAQKAVDAIAERVQRLAKERELLLPYLCMTFATASQKVLGSYGDDNLKRMRHVAAKYDPEGVFQELQHNGFLLRNSV